MAFLLKNKVTILLFASALWLLFSCNQSNNLKNQEEKNVPDTVVCKNPNVNPNGDSELALLMRKMLSQADSLKIAVQHNKKWQSFPEEFNLILTAKPTDDQTKKPGFNAFAISYLDQLKTLYQSPPSELRKNYNMVINTCISCHEEHCPGPLTVINKLKLQE